MQRKFEDTHVFLNKLKWKTYTKEFTEMQAIRVDCYQFKFEQCLTEEQQYAFIDYMNTLDLTTELAFIKMAIWLQQHDIGYTLKFSWDCRLPIRHNFRKIGRPWLINRYLDTIKDKISNIDLSTFAATAT